METINIGYGHMALGFLLLIIPTYFLYRYRTGLVKDTLIAALRMTVQLFLIGFYLEYESTFLSFAPPCGLASLCCTHCSTCVAQVVRGMMI